MKVGDRVRVWDVYDRRWQRGTLTALPTKDFIFASVLIDGLYDAIVPWADVHPMTVLDHMIDAPPPPDEDEPTPPET